MRTMVNRIVPVLRVRCTVWGLVVCLAAGLTGTVSAQQTGQPMNQAPFTSQTPLTSTAPLTPSAQRGASAQAAAQKAKAESEQRAKEQAKRVQVQKAAAKLAAQQAAAQKKAQASAQKGMPEQSVFTPPQARQTAPYRTAGNQAARYHIRPSENPPRFAFAPKDDPSNADQDPSASAIWSTLITGNISPEIVRWHLRQRAKVHEYQVLARENPEAARRVLESMKDEKRSNYDRMVSRTRFAFSPDRYSFEPQTGMSNDAILARFLTGRDHGELQQWRTEQETGPMPDNTMPDNTMIAWQRPYSDQLYSDQLYSDRSYSVNPSPQEIYRQPPEPDLILTANRDNRDNRTRSETAAYPAQEAVPLPNDGEYSPSGEYSRNTRYFNDDFPGTAHPAAWTAGGTSPAARPVGWISRSEAEPCPGTMKVYQDRGTTGGSYSMTAEPLPAAADSNGWSPVKAD